MGWADPSVVIWWEDVSKGATDEDLEESRICGGYVRC